MWFYHSNIHEKFCYKPGLQASARLCLLSSKPLTSLPVPLSDSLSPQTQVDYFKCCSSYCPSFTYFLLFCGGQVFFLLLGHHPCVKFSNKHCCIFSALLSHSGGAPWRFCRNICTFAPTFPQFLHYMLSWVQYKPVVSRSVFLYVLSYTQILCLFSAQCDQILG